LLVTIGGKAMSADRLDHVLGSLDPAKRALIKKMAIGVAFAVPTVASFAVKDVAFAAVGSPGTTVFTATVGGTTTVFTPVFISTTTTRVTTVTTTAFPT
jgi:hypothetical protein